MARRRLKGTPPALKNKGGRPFKEFDVEQLKKLAAIHCTMDEMASILGVSKDTLERSYAEVIKEAQDNGKASLRRQMWLKAQDGNVTMMIWLSKNLLGFRDHQDIVLQAKPNDPKGFFIEGLDDRGQPALTNQPAIEVKVETKD